MFTLFHQPDSEISLVAGGVKQCNIHFENIYKGFTKHPNVKRRLKANESTKEIRDLVGGGKIQVYSTSLDQADGFASVLTIMDELAFWRSGTDRKLFDAISDSDMALANGLKILISTPGESHQSLFKELVDQAQKIVDGDDLNPTILPVIFGLPKDSPLEIDDPRAWKIAHPGYGTLVTEQKYREKYESVKHSPLQLNNFKIRWLGRWVGSLESFISSTAWGACKNKDLDEDDFAGERAILNVDFGGKYDLYSHVITVWKDNKAYYFPRFALTEKAYELKQKEYSDYISWYESGLLKLFPTGKGEDENEIDRAMLRAWVEEDLRKFDVEWACLDPYNLKEFSEWLSKDKGVNVCHVHTNNYNEMGPLLLQFEQLVLTQSVVHPDNKILNWNIENMGVKMDQANRIKPKRHAGDKNKIDGAICCVMACQALSELQNDSGWVASFSKR